MLRLLTFGGLRVVRDDGGSTDLANQRRRLAVLAVVAAEAPRGVSRERLGLLLWPDADADRARHALNQIVYNLRRELGASPIDGVAELCLLPEVMSCDLIDFREALARGDHAGAAELYQGAFLDRFTVPGASEFDEWVEEERLRCLRQAVLAIEKLAVAAESAGDLPMRVQWTQRLVELDPLSARRALTHMRALEEHGDVGAAIAYGRRYDVLVRSDDDDVDPAVALEVARLRALPVAPIVVARTTPDAVTPVASGAAPAPSADAAPVAPAPLEQVAPPRDLTPVLLAAADVHPAPPRPRIVRWLLAGTASVAVLVGALSLSRERTPTIPLTLGDRLLMAEVQVTAVDTANVRAIAYALQSALQQSSHVHFVSPRSVAETLRRMGRSAPVAGLSDSTALEVAEREGARYVVSLGVTPAAGTRVVSLRVLEPSTGAALQTYTTTADAGDLLGAIDVVAASLRRDLGDTKRELAAAMPLPRATTPSIEALRLYAGATSAYNRGSYKDARALYEGALALDSGFAAAHAGMANLAYVYNNVREGDAHMARALALADRLPPRERLLIEATAARGASDWSRAATLHRAYLIRYPDDYDMYGSLGYDLMRTGAAPEALAAYDSLKAHRALQASDLINIASIHSLRSDYRSVRQSHAAALRLDSTLLVRAMQNEQIAKALLALGFADSARMVHAAMVARDGLDRARGHRGLAYVDLYEGRYASAVTHLTRAIELYALDSTSKLSEVRDRALLANTLIELGEIPAARQQLSVASRLCVTRSLPPQALFWVGKALLRLGELTSGRRLLDSARARTRPTDTDEQAATAALEAEYQVAAGRAGEGVTLADRALILEPDLADYIETRAFALERSGALKQARDAYVTLSDRLLGAIEVEGQQRTRLAPLAVARLDAQLGQADEARRTLGTFLERWPNADVTLPMVQRPRAVAASRGTTPPATTARP